MNGTRTRDLADHVHAAIEGRNRCQMCRLAAKHTNPSRTKEFVAGHDVEITVDVADVGGQDVSLRAVDQHLDTAGMCVFTASFTGSTEQSSSTFV